MITVYCSPVFNINEEFDWNILYKTPMSLYEEKRKLLPENVEKNSNLLYCPSFKNVAQNTFVIRNPITSKYFFTSEGIKSSEGSMPLDNYWPSGRSFVGNFNVVNNQRWVFFTDQSLEMTLTGPYFDHTSYQHKATIAPGMLNIGKWFRTINHEFIVADGTESLEFKESEALSYVRFHTEEKVKLERFYFTSELWKALEVCNTSSSWERFVPLQKRYKRFMETKQNKKVLKLIRENLY